MYCSSCGAVVAHNLIYCNHCGEKLNGAKDFDGRAADIKPEMLVGAIAATFLFGMAAIVLLVIATKKLDFNEAIAIALLAASFLLLLAIEGVFIWLLLSRRKVEKNTRVSNRLDQVETKELYTTPAQALTEPMPSAIEQTTNLLEPIYRDQKSG